MKIISETRKNTRLSDDDGPPVLSPMMPLLRENMSAEQSASHKFGSVLPLSEKEIKVRDLSEIRNGSSPKSVNLYEKELPDNPTLDFVSNTFIDRGDREFENTKVEFDENSAEENDEQEENDEEENDEQEENEEENDEIEDSRENEEYEENEEFDGNEEMYEHEGNEDNEENDIELQEENDIELHVENEDNEENDIELHEVTEENDGNEESEGSEEENEEHEDDEEREGNIQLDDLEGAVLMVAEGDQILIQQDMLEDENENSKQEYVYSTLRYSSEEDSDDARK